MLSIANFPLPLWRKFIPSLPDEIKNSDTEHDDSLSFNSFQDFIESLRKASDITIDSTIVKTFILENRIYI